jgi:hypothetical protein
LPDAPLRSAHCAPPHRLPHRLPHRTLRHAARRTLQGCREYPSGGGITYVFDKNETTKAPYESLCDEEAWPITAYIFFHTFIIIAAIIIIQMFVGAVAIAMIDVMDGMSEKKDLDRKHRQRAVKLKVLRTYGTSPDQVRAALTSCALTLAHTHERARTDATTIRGSSCR